MRDLDMNQKKTDGSKIEAGGAEREMKSAQKYFEMAKESTQKRSGTAHEKNRTYTGIIDMHCDTITELYEKRRNGEDAHLRKNDMHIDLERMKQAGYLCQSFAVYTNLRRTEREGVTPYTYAMQVCDIWDAEIAANADLIGKVLNGSDIEANMRQGRMSALMTVEEGAVYEGSVDKLHDFYRRGVRKSTLTWNFENELGYPNRKVWIDDIEDTITTTDKSPEHGLKEAGKEIVKEMERLHMLIDLSHLNDAGIWDVLSLTKAPVLASHSNTRAEAYHARNLSDEMLRVIAVCGGVCGINFYAPFLVQRAIWPYTEAEKHSLFSSAAARLTPDGFDSRIDDMIRHIRHMKKVAGIDAIGLGTDFDGIGGRLEINGAAEMPKLAERLASAGFTGSEVDKIMGKNVLRVYKEVLG